MLPHYNRCYLGGDTELNQGTADYNQLGNEGMAAWGPTFSAFQQLIPILQQTLSGEGSLYEAARSPAIAQTEQGIATMQNQAGGQANPNALYEQIATGVEQTASLGANQILTSALSSLQSLISGGMNFSGQSLGTAGQGETQIGEYEQNQMNQWIQSIFGAAGGGIVGGGAGGALSKLFGGGGASGGTPGFNAGSTEFDSSMQSGSTELDSSGMAPWGGVGQNPMGSYGFGVPPSASGMSAPISSPQQPGMEGV
jgi:hypothetical protein